MPPAKRAVPSVQVNIKLYLRPDEDADLLQLFQSIPPQQRARAIKLALRSGTGAAVLSATLADDAAHCAATLLEDSGLVF